MDLSPSDGPVRGAALRWLRRLALAEDGSVSYPSPMIEEAKTTRRGVCEEDP
jgi:hypothetical protein